MDNCTLGREAALQKLGLAKDYSDVHAKLRELAKPSLFNRFEGMFTPNMPADTSDTSAHAAAATLKEQLRKRHNVHPHLVGSMATGLNLPGTADMDFYINVKSPAKYDKLLPRLAASGFKPRLKDSTGDMTVFYQKGKTPIDLTVARGAPADAYSRMLKNKKDIVASLPADLKKAILKKKHLLKHSPLDFGGDRYYAFKKDLGVALGNPYHKLEKISTLIDLSDPHQLDKFTRFVNDENLYGHRTHNLQSVLEQGHLSAALEALHKGRLKSYEAGHTQGTHTALPYADLSPENLSLLEKNILSATPNTGVYDEIAGRLGSSADQIKGNFIRQRYNKIRQFLRGQQDPEAFRRANLAIPKLGPNIFLNKGGVLDTPSYGNASLLFHTNKAVPSPFMNLVTNEYIVPPKDVMAPQHVPIRHGYTLLPQADIAGFEKTHPEMKYVAQESLPENLRGQLFKPTHDIKETWERWAPAVGSGKLEVLETR